MGLPGCVTSVVNGCNDTPPSTLTRSVVLVDVARTDKMLNTQLLSLSFTLGVMAVGKGAECREGGNERMCTVGSAPVWCVL